MPTVQEVWRDPEFHQLPPPEKAKVMQQLDPDFAALPLGEQNKVVFQLSNRNIPSSGGKATYGNPNASPAETERMRREFVEKEGTAGTRVKEGAKTAVKAAMPYVRPVLEGGGAAVGGIVGAGSGFLAGAGLGAIPGTVAGGSLGYAGGKSLADVLEQVPTSAGQTLKDLGTGAMYEMGGGVAGVALSGAAKQVPRIAAAVRSPIQTRAASKARQVLEATAGLTEQEAANAAKAQALESKLGVKLTPAQRTAKPSTSALEQGLATADPEFSAALTARDTAAKDAALGKIRQVLGKGKPLPQAADTAMVGQNITGKLKSTLDPIKKEERRMWEEVPNYPIPAKNFESAAAAIKHTPMEAETEAAVNRVLDFAARVPKTTQGLQSIERTIGDKMTSGDANIRRVLGDLKKAIGEDFQAMSEAAEAGDVALSEGKIVHPSRLQAEIDSLKERIQSETAATATTPDMKQVQAALRDAGDPPNQWMKQVNETEAQYNNRLITRYHQKVGVDVPMVGGTKPATASEWESQIAKLENQLANLQPADNVAAKYKAAKDFSRTQKFDRFGKGPVARVLQRGNEASGLRTADENVPRQFFTPSGAAGLVKAVGKTAAKEQMRPHVITDMMRTAAPNGVDFNIQAGINYIQKNRATLHRLDLMDDAQQFLKDQLPAELERMLAKRAPDAVTGKQFFTGNDMRGILQKYGATIKQLYGPEALQSFRDYNSLVNMIDRKNVVPRGGNSNTAEKAMNVANLMLKEATGPAKRLTDGLLGAMAQGAGIGTGATFAAGHVSGKGAVAGAAVMGVRQLAKNAESQVAKTFAKILQDATLNPEVARDLMRVQRTGKVPPLLQAIIDNNLIGPAAIAVSGKEEEE